MQRTRCKICGLTRPEDIQAAVKAGADALGLVFYPPSPRAVTIDQAVELMQAVPPFVVTVGLFVNPEPEWVEAVLSRVPLDLLQFHGDEDEALCRQFHRPYIKALRMKPELDPVVEARRWPSAKGFLLDAYQPGVPGGTGEQFDWKRFPGGTDQSWILAGGLTPDNIRQAVQATQPYAVDVSGGVEASRGIKCPTKVTEFIANLAHSDH
ncbi:phosphoribosylanthranilate isomerase [Marinospirillum sp.]|uniref:phosphoribosylanthranilate isomerase n=1 Tax=Marinospirillum sp. TaxID=2183934 RepID=UPI00286FDA41|nr:phosphoribosylanthranilate isomerase [Marinospirillum sp.]MDR9467210.1 phosphoribosylanthranilate isomerase [Marinospirillum sp.]